MNKFITLGGDLEVNRLGFGAMRLTGDGIWGEPKDPEEAKAVLRRCIELGVTFIDTADSYGPEVSERLIGETLAPYADGLVIATKGGLVRPGPGDWKMNGSPQHLQEALEGSLQRLKLEQIDLYQLHRIDSKVPTHETFQFLKEAQQAGKIRHIGLSEVGVQELRDARKEIEVVSVQNRYNVGDREHEDVLTYCEEEGIAFIPWSPLAAGELSAPGSKLAEIAQAHEATTGQIAIAWLLAHSLAILPIPGTSSVGHLEENVASADILLSAAELQQLDNLA